MLIDYTRFLFENYKREDFKEMAIEELIKLLPEKEKTREFAEGLLDVMKHEEIRFNNGVSINLLLHVVCIDNEAVNLTPCEVQIVETLAQAPGYKLDFESLSQKVWHYKVDMCNIRVNINNIRRKMGFDFIENIKGKGYKLNV